MLNREQFIGAVKERAGIARPEIAERAVKATLEVLGERLADLHARMVADRLPDGLAGMLRRRADRDAEYGAEEFYRRVARREGVDEGFAREHAQAVCEVLGRELDDTGRKHLSSDLPGELARLFEPRVTGEPPPYGAPVHHEAERSLSGGKPGARHSLSEARTDGAQPDSVAATDAPYADRQLSTARGTTQEQGQDTLAEGAPGSRKPLHG